MTGRSRQLERSRAHWEAANGIERQRLDVYGLTDKLRVCRTLGAAEPIGPGARTDPSRKTASRVHGGP